MTTNICTRCGNHVFPTIQVKDRGETIDTYCNECEDKRLIESYADQGRVTFKLLDRFFKGSLKRHSGFNLYNIYDALSQDLGIVYLSRSNFDDNILKGWTGIYNFLSTAPPRQHKLDTPTIRVTAMRHVDGITFNITRVEKPDPWISLWLNGVFPSDFIAVNGKPSEIADLFAELTQVLKVQGPGIFVHANDLVPTH